MSDKDVKDENIESKIDEQVENAGEESPEEPVKEEPAKTEEPVKSGDSKRRSRQRKPRGVISEILNVPDDAPEELPFD
jgi:hypothetical protein